MVYNLTLVFTILTFIFTTLVTFKSKGAIPILWMHFWLLVSVINPLKLNFSPTIIAIFVNFSTLFALIGYIVGSKYGNFSPTSRSSLHLIKKRTLNTYYLMCVPISILAYFSFKLLQNISIFKYRRMILSEPENLFGHPLILPIFQLFIEGILLLLLLSSIYFLLENKSKYLIIFSLIIAILFSVIFLGRYHIYRIIVVTFVFALVQLRSAHILKLFPSFAIMVFIVVYGTVLRSGGLFGVQEIFIKHVIGYHTFGYNLAESYVISAENLIDRTWLGGSMIASIFYFLLKPLQYIYDFTTYLQSADYYEQDIFKYLGTIKYSNKSLDLNANAFYTIFTDIWRDFSWLGVAFFFPIGFLTGFSYRGLVQKNYYLAISYYIISYVFLFAQMKNPFVRHEMFIPMFFAFFVLFMRKK